MPAKKDKPVKQEALKDAETTTELKTEALAPEQQTTPEAQKPDTSKEEQSSGSPAAPRAAAEGSESASPARDRRVSLLFRQKMQMSPDSPYVYHPRFVNKEQTIIKAIVKLPDGRLTEVEADRNDVKSPFIRDVFAQYTEEEIKLFTEKQLQMMAVRRELDQRIAEDNLISNQRERIYAAKSEAFQIPEINTPENAQIKNKIRQARSVAEVQAWTTAALLKSLKDEA